MITIMLTSSASTLLNGNVLKTVAPLAALQLCQHQFDDILAIVKEVISKVIIVMKNKYR